jgi:nucleoside-diphosphate kinase
MAQTFIMLKPDAVRRGLKDAILARFLNEGIKVFKEKELIVDEKLILSHYHDVIERVNQPYFKQAILDVFVHEKVYAIVLESDSPTIIEDVRTLLGATDPSQASPESIRGQYKDDDLKQAMAEKRIVRNLVHASDSEASFKEEVSLWFKD